MVMMFIHMLIFRISIYNIVCFNNYSILFMYSEKSDLIKTIWNINDKTFFHYTKGNKMTILFDRTQYHTIFLNNVNILKALLNTETLVSKYSLSRSIKVAKFIESHIHIAKLLLAL